MNWWIWPNNSLGVLRRSCSGRTGTLIHRRFSVHAEALEAFRKFFSTRSNRHHTVNPILQYCTSPIFDAYLLPIRHRRHSAWNAALRQLGFIDGAHLRRFIFVIHDSAAFAFRDGGEIILADATLAPAQGQMQSRLRAGSKVGVIPSFGRHQQAAFAPINFDEGLLSRIIFRPHERVSLAAQHDHLSAGAMKMGLSISAAADGHDVTDHRFVTRSGNAEPAVVNATPRIFGQRHGVNVRNEINRSILELSLFDLA